jgi:hypothetical protein
MCTAKEGHSIRPRIYLVITLRAARINFFKYEPRDADGMLKAHLSQVIYASLLWFVIGYTLVPP